MVTIDGMLRQARLSLERLTPRQALAAMQGGAVLLDIRPEFQRRADGDLPGAVVVERVHLEWRGDPASAARVSEAVDHRFHCAVSSRPRAAGRSAARPRPSR